MEKVGRRAASFPSALPLYSTFLMTTSTLLVCAGPIRANIETPSLLMFIEDRKDQDKTTLILTRPFTAFRASSGVSFQQEKLSTHDIASLEELSASEGNYRVRIGSTQSVFASVPACRVLASNFVDQLTVHMSGSKVIGISYHVDSNDCVNKRPSSSAAQSGAQWTTSSRVDVGHDAPRPNLDPTGAGKPVTAPGGAPPQQVQEEPGFFAKYVRISACSCSYWLFSGSIIYYMLLN